MTILQVIYNLEMIRTAFLDVNTREQRQLVNDTFEFCINMLRMFHEFENQLCAYEDTDALKVKYVKQELELMKEDN